ncbi:MAG: 5'-3' exonuclease [Candidatus Nealsonbacteria bacterium]
MNGKKKRLIIIDSNSLIHRAYHALPPLTTKKGELVNAVYGFILVFLKALKEFQPDFIAACFDLPGPTFRHKKFKEYKAKRPPTPEELYQQIPKVKEILRGFNVPIFEKEGFEADDIIGTISKLAPKKQIIPEIETLILSGDLDILQLVDKNTKVYTFKKGLKDTIIYDEKAVKERYSLSPSQLIDFRALKGDSSDNIPGVIGIGEKTAIQLIKLFGSLENLYREIKEETGRAKEIKPAIKERLIKYKEQAFFSKMLSEIRKDAPIDFNLKKCQWKGYIKEKLVQILRNFEFYSLLEKLPKA